MADLIPDQDNEPVPTSIGAPMIRGGLNPEASRLFRSYRTISNMLMKRGYMIPKEMREMTPETFKQRFGEHPSREALTILVVCILFFRDPEFAALLPNISNNFCSYNERKKLMIARISCSSSFLRTKNLELNPLRSTRTAWELKMSEMRLLVSRTILFYGEQKNTSLVSDFGLSHFLFPPPLQYCEWILLHLRSRQFKRWVTLFELSISKRPNYWSILRSTNLFQNIKY